ncbi:MAG: NAD(P)-dependent oxidoreductase [Corynebacterium nuruki]|nr:NAD(P)-dependent oxidoreductase [Corynebacterium nuruki]
MRIIATGATGQVGRELVALGAGPLTRRELDLTGDTGDTGDTVMTAARRLFAGAEAVIHTAAFTAVDAAEDPSNAAEVTAVNAVAPGLLARAAREVGARFIHVSTDYVFSGRPAGDRPWRVDDPVRPVNVYGATKEQGERGVLEAGGTVVRTSWVWSGPAAPGKDFVTTMAGLAARGVDPQVVDDQTGRPTYAPDLAAGLWDLARRPDAATPGILNYTNSGEPVTWCGLARAVFAGLGHDPERVRPCTTAEYPTPAPRPEWSVLDLAPWTAAVGRPPEWRDALARGLRW